MIRIKNPFKKVPNNLEHVATLKGYDFYTPKSLIEGTVSKRYYKFRHILESRELFKLNKESRDIAFDQMEKHIDLNQTAAVAQWIGLLRAMNDLTYWDKELFDVANCFLLLDGEPLEDFSEKHTKIKYKLFENDEDVKVFFCQFAHEYMRHIADLPANTSVLDYMNQRTQKLVNTIYGRLILSQIDKESGTK